MDTNENTQALSGRQSFEEYLACSSELNAIYDRMRRCEQLHQVDFISSALIKLQEFLVDHYNNTSDHCFRDTPAIVAALDRYTYMEMAKELNYNQSPAGGGNG